MNREKRYPSAKIHFTSLHQNHSPTEVIEAFRQFYGPTMNAYEAAEKNGKVDNLHSQLVELAKAHNTNNQGGTSIAATFLRVTVSL